MFLDRFNKGIFKTKYLILILLVIYLPIAINGMVLYKRALTIEKKDRLLIVRHMMDQSAANVETELFNIRQLMEKLTHHNGVKKSIQIYGEQEVVNRTAMETFLSERIEETVNGNTYIDSSYLVSREGAFFTSDHDAFVDPKQLFIYLNQKYSDLGSLEWFVDVLKTEEFEALSMDMVVAVQPVYILNSTEIVGYLICNLNVAKMVQENDLSDVGYSVRTALYLKEMSKLIESEKTHINIERIDQVIEKNMNSKLYELANTDKDTIIQTVPIQNTTWYLVSGVDEKDLLVSIRKAMQNNFLLLLHITLTTSFLLVTFFVVGANVYAEKDAAQYRLEMSEEWNQKLRVYKHDFMNHLQVVQALIELDYKEKAIDYIRKLADEGKIVKCKCDIGIPEIESAIFTHVAPAKEAGINVEVKCVDLSENFRYDTFEVVKILTNLIRNAVHASVNDENDTKYLGIEIFKNEKNYIFVVKNSGPLISEEDQTRVFEKGYSTNKEEGRGLGLFIVKRIVDHNKGSVTLSVDKSGNTFRVELPF